MTDRHRRLLTRHCKRTRSGAHSPRLSLALACAGLVLVAAAPPATAHREHDARLARLERVLGSNSLLRMQATLERMEGELRQLRGEIELQGHRLSRLERAQAAGGASASRAQPEAGPAVGVAAEQQAYRGAFARLQARDYEGAARAFEQFLVSFPGGQFTSNAVYWLGESHYALGEYPLAIESFERLVAQYPTSPKFTHALLKMGFSYDEQGDAASARAALERIVNEFPQSETAGLAQQRLANLKSG